MIAWVPTSYLHRWKWISFKASPSYSWAVTRASELTDTAWHQPCLSLPTQIPMCPGLLLTEMLGQLCHCRPCDRQGLCQTDNLWMPPTFRALSWAQCRGGSWAPSLALHTLLVAHARSLPRSFINSNTAWPPETLLSVHSPRTLALNRLLIRPDLKKHTHFFFPFKGLKREMEAKCSWRHYKCQKRIKEEEEALKECLHVNVLSWPWSELKSASYHSFIQQSFTEQLLYARGCLYPEGQAVNKLGKVPALN